MVRSLLTLLSVAVAFTCVSCQTRPVFVDQNAYFPRPSKSLLCRILAEREYVSWWGFIDRSGKVVVEPLLTRAEDFSEGRALVTVDLEQVAIGQDGSIFLYQSPGVKAWQQGKRDLPPKKEMQCFIDATGKVVSKLFDAPNDYDCYLADGVALVHQSSGTFVFYRERYGYVDGAGNWIIPPSYPEAHPFFEGLGRVRPSGINAGRAGILGAGPVGYVDATGKLAIPAQFAVAGDFHEGLAAVSKDGIRWGYIDKSGKMVIGPKFGYATDFHEGLAVAKEESTRLLGYIDRAGNWAIPPKYVLAREFSEGLASIAEDTETWKEGFVNSKGVEVIRPQYDWAGPFHDGLAPVAKDENGKHKYGYINRDGRVVTPLTFDETHPLADGMGRIELQKKSGFVDRTGKIVIAPQYGGWGDFFGGLALVSVNRDGKSSMMCIDKTGKTVWREAPAPVGRSDSR